MSEVPGRPGMLRLLVRGLTHLAGSGQLLGSPRAVSLALVDWYRANVSAGRDRCPTGRRLRDPAQSCSAYGRRVLARHGALLGWSLLLWRLVLCTGHPGDGDDDCCLDCLADLWPSCD